MRQSPAISDKVAPHDVATEQAVLRILVLAATELDAVASLAARHLDPQLRSRVLGKAIQEDARGRLLYRSRGFALERLDPRTAQWLQFARRRARQTCSLPSAIIKPHAVPARLLRACGEILARIDVGKHDWPIGGAPGVIGADAAGFAAGWLETNLGAEQERLVGLSLGTMLVVATRGCVRIVPERIAEHHAYAIGPLRYQR